MSALQTHEMDSGVSNLGTLRLGFVSGQQHCCAEKTHKGMAEHGI